MAAYSAVQQSVATNAFSRQYKKLPLFHLYDSNLTGTQKLLMTLLLVERYDIYDLSCLARMRPEDVAADLAELKRKGYLQDR